MPCSLRFLLVAALLLLTLVSIVLDPVTAQAASVAPAAPTKAPPTATPVPATAQPSPTPPPSTPTAPPTPPATASPTLPPSPPTATATASPTQAPSPVASPRRLAVAGRLHIAPTSLAPGGLLEVLASDYGPRETLSVWLTDPAGAVSPGPEQTTTGEGTAHFTLDLPAAAGAGRWALTVQGQASGRVTVVSFTVAGASATTIVSPTAAPVTPQGAAASATPAAGPPADAPALVNDPTPTAEPPSPTPTATPEPTPTATPRADRDISHLLPPAAPGGSPSPRLLRTYFGAASRASGVPVEILLAVAAVESGFQPSAVGPLIERFAGTEDEHALGMMQFLPSTYRPYAPIVDRITGKNLGMRGIWDPESAVYASAFYLRDSGARTNIHRALFAYNNADWYVRLVLAWSNFYANGGAIGSAPVIDPALIAGMRDPSVPTLTAQGEQTPSPEHGQSERSTAIGDGLLALLLPDWDAPSWPNYPTQHRALSR